MLWSGALAAFLYVMLCWTLRTCDVSDMAAALKEFPVWWAFTKKITPAPYGNAEENQWHLHSGDYLSFYYKESGVRTRCYFKRWNCIFAFSLLFYLGLNTNVTFSALSESPRGTQPSPDTSHSFSYYLLHCLHSTSLNMLFFVLYLVAIVSPHSNISSMRTGILSILFTLNLLGLKKCLEINRWPY